MRSAADLISNEHYSKVQGWMHPNIPKILEAWASSYLPTLECTDDFGASLEIGVHHGKMFLAIEAVTPPNIDCFAVDVFDDQERNIDMSGKGSLEIFTRNVSQIALDPKRVIPIMGDSFSIKGQDKLTHSYSLISIDGGHTREHTGHDLSYADSTIKPGGLVVLDDFNNVNWLGVMEGALDYLGKPDRRLAPFMVGFNKLYLTTITEYVKSSSVMENFIEKNFSDISLGRVSMLRGHLVRCVK
jgi:hypothetical protein